MHLYLVAKFTKCFRQVYQVKVPKKRSCGPLLNLNWYIQIGCLLVIFFLWNVGLTIEKKIVPFFKSHSLPWVKSPICSLPMPFFWRELVRSVPRLWTCAERLSPLRWALKTGRRFEVDATPPRPPLPILEAKFFFSFCYVNGNCDM